MKTTLDIVSDIYDNGGFDNFRKWNTKEIATWVKANYNCSYYVANRVANKISTNF